MKYLFILFPFFMFGQQTNRPDIVDPILTDFHKEAAVHNLYLQPFLNANLKGIYVVPTSEFKRFIGERNDHRAGTIAYYSNYLMNRKEVMILLDSKYSIEDMEAFLYHELGHILGLDHTTGIMAKEINYNVMTPFNIEEYFTRIKNVPPNRYRTHTNL